ncbi:MAG: DegT/DnrJ/EryC1/StrS family aminotransferase [Coriobacteriales bacterium]|jgi:dTDP-4-amino-4,6-dideoxygalactose transaminase|nr:DegT/DnrJ/EryC1/StrS family aminotransferase [Coriobacteriales bacterium]
MQFVDLGRQFEQIEQDVRRNIDAVLSSQHYIMGAQVAQLEEKLAAFSGAPYALGCSNGTDALVLLLMALGVGPGDAVFVPTFTFFSTAECVSTVGATPVFVDVDADTFNIDVVSLKAAIAATLAQGALRPRGIIPVDLFGLPADYDAIRVVADEQGLFVLEDAAQGLGGEYHGKRAGSLGDVAATSFFPAKPLGCYGDGGAVFVKDAKMAELCKSIRIHGQGTDRYDNVRLGMNGRLDTLQAAVLLAKLKVFEGEIAARNRIAALYTQALEAFIKVPRVPEGYRSVWAQYTLTAKDEGQRDTIVAQLKEKGIPVMIYYPTPLHRATAYASLGYAPGSLLVSERLAKTVFSIPMHPYLRTDEIEMITAAVKEAIR